MKIWPSLNVPVALFLADGNNQDFSSLVVINVCLFGDGGNMIFHAHVGIEIRTSPWSNGQTDTAIYIDSRCIE